MKPIAKQNQDSSFSGKLSGSRRPLGLAPFPMKIEDSFFDPLPDDILDAFEGKNTDEFCARK